MLVTSVLIELITNPDNTRTRAVNTGRNTRREQDPGTENYRSETQRRATERERERENTDLKTLWKEGTGETNRAIRKCGKTGSLNQNKTHEDNRKQLE